MQRATRDKYSVLSLVAVQRIQRQQAGLWQELPQELLAQEPKPCLVEGSD